MRSSTIVAALCALGATNASRANSASGSAISYVNLTYGQPYQDSVYSPPGSPAYTNFVYFIYWYVPQPPNAGFRVRCSTLTDGKDVDIFVSDYNVVTPTNLNCVAPDCTIAATDYVEIVDVFPPICPPGGAPCPYYIGVSGYTSGQHSFSIVITEPAVPTPLFDGQPSGGFVTQNAWVYFSFSTYPANTAMSVTVSLESISGDPDLYVALNSPAAPSPSNSQYSIMGLQGPNLLVMPAADPNFISHCPVGGLCVMSVGIFGYTPSVFVITMSTNTATVNLTEGLPTTRTVAAGSWSYFAYAPPVSGTISLACTSISGDPDMYVSTILAQPGMNPGQSTWQSATEADEVITILTSDPAYVAPPGAVYYIGVYGYANQNSTFTMLASTAGSGAPGSAVILSDGQPQAGSAAPHTFAMYTFNITKALPLGQPAPSLDAFVVPQAGDVDLYISNLTDTLGNVIFPTITCGPTNPSTGQCTYVVDPTTYTWSSTASGIQDIVSLSSSQLTFGQQLAIGVLATTPDGPPGTPAPPPSVFSVTASTSNGIISLQAGVPVPGIVSARQFKYYKLSLNVYGADILVAADVRGGQLDMYAAESTIIPRPAPGNSTYNTTGGGGILKDKILRIPWASLSNTCVLNIMFGGAQCDIIIAVQGYPGMGMGGECVYELSAAATGSPASPTLLPDGSSQYLYIPHGGAEYLYAFAAAPQGSAIYIVVQDLLPGSTSQLYLNLGVSGKGFWVPGSGTIADWVSVDAGGYQRIILTDPNVTTSSSRDKDADLIVRLGADAVTGFVSVQGPEADARVGSGSARVVQRLPDGRTILEVHLPSPHGDVVEVSPGRSVRAMGVQAQHMGVGPWAGSALAKHELKRPLPSEDDSGEGEGDGQVSFPIRPPYCNPCELFITVTAVGQYDTYAMIDFHTGNKVVPLSDGVPTYGIAVRDGTPSYFSYTITDPLADLSLNFNRIFGSEDVWIIVQPPSTPWVLPSAAASTWQFTPSLFSPTFNLSHTDPAACIPGDGTRAGAPCTYIFGVTSRWNATAAYLVTATGAAASLPVLYDGQPTAGSVTEGSVQYYTFQASAPGYPAPAVILTWTNLLGQVQAYVTNQYFPGNPSSLLPGPASTACQWACTNYTGCFMQPGDPCYSPRSPDGSPVMYTIGIVGYTGIVPFVSTYMLTASIQGDPTRLSLGVPTTDIFLPNQYNLNFTFELPDANSDVVISASVNKGDAVILIAHDDQVNFVIPSCTPPHSGAQLVCGGYTWMATGVGETVVYIPAAAPCTPVMPAGTQGIMTGGDCGPTGQGAAVAFRPGRYWVVLYGMSEFSELSLMVNNLNGPVPRYLLADGQPQDMQTGPITVCPGGSRDPVSFACNNTAVPQQVVQGSIFLFRVPSTVPFGDIYVQIERLCGGNHTGACGSQLVVAANGCTAATCTARNLVPYMNDAAVSYVIPDVIGGVWVPFGACYGLRIGTADCLYAVAVYPSTSDPAKPGLNAGPALFRATLATPVGVQRVSQDCYANGAVCTLPEHTVLSGGKRRYEGYAGTSVSPVAMTLKTTLCSGDPSNFYIYICADGGACGQFNEPGPSNNDYIARGDNKGFASIQFNQGTDIFFAAVTASTKAGLSEATFQLSLQGGQGPVLILNPSDPYVASYRDPSLTVLTVSWVTPLLKWAIPGQQPITPANVQYFVAAFPIGSTGQAQLNTPCGIDDAIYNQVPGAILLPAPVIGATSAVLTGLSSSASYSIAVVALCPPVTCMLYNDQGQRIAFAVSQNDPTPPAPTSIPSPAPPSSKASTASPTGPIVGGIVGALLFAGVGFFAYRRFGGATVGVNAYVRASNTAPWFTSSAGGAYANVPQSDSLMDRFSAGGGGTGYMPPQAVDAGGMGEAYSAL